MVWDSSQARSLFAESVEVPDWQIDVGRAAVLLSLEDDPDAALEPTMARFDALASGLPPDLAAATPHEQLRIMSRHLHGLHGFRGNRDAYYAPANSLITKVLESRAGIPITLALLHMEVGRRCGVPLLPIGLPGHLVLRHAGDSDAYLDPFTGEVLDAQSCLERVVGVGAADRLPVDVLAPLGPRPFLLRMLNNLKGAYLRLDPPDLAGAVAACARILLVYPDAPSELRDRGLLQMQLRRRAAALCDLERYCALAPHAQDVEAIASQAQSLYRELAKLN